MRGFGGVLLHVPEWWNGRHRGLKILRPHGRAGSNPASGTILIIGVTHMPDLGTSLHGVSRCPHCGIAAPNLYRIYISPKLIPTTTASKGSKWALYACSTCGYCVSARGKIGQDYETTQVQNIFPRPQSAHADIPPIARKFLQQAYETLHAPDAAAVMAGSAVDAMLKEHDYTKGSVYARIEQAVKDHLLTEAMGEWAHSVRLGSNRPRHADADNPHVSEEEAKRSVEFAESLGNFLFVLSAQIQRGIDAAKEEDEAK